MAPKIAIQSIQPLVRRLQYLGLSPPALLLQYGLEPSLLDEVDARLPLTHLDGLWEEAAIRTGDELFGVHAAADISEDTFGLISYLGATSPTWGAGLRRVCTYFRIFSDASDYQLIENDAAVAVLAHQDLPRRGPFRHRSEFTVGVLLEYARRFCDAPWCPLEVFFEHERPASAPELERIFGCRVRFGTRHQGFSFNPSYLHVPLRLSNPGLVKILERFAGLLLDSTGDHPTCVQAVRAVLLQQLARGAQSLDAVASELGMSARTLQRHLRGAGTTFRVVLDEVQFSAAKSALARADLSIDDVAFLLGFSEPSAFHRAFGRWSGTTPGRYRALLRGSSPSST
ncbi:MAG: AraC family transcriptional regulator [Proteobacteria bacterium]|nr:AraC family transcriptional regulator [Pseudomonadota bacterium]